MHLFPVIREGKYGYMDAEGHVRVPIKLASGMDFTEGLAGVLVAEGGKWGFIDETGAVVIDPRFDSVRPFSEGYAVVTLGKKKSYIDRTGTPAFELRCYRCESFCNGVAQIQKTMTDDVTLINTSGHVILSGRNYYLSEYREGLINCGERGKWGFMRLDGTFKIPAKYTFARPFHEGLAAVSDDKNEESFKFIDTSGKTVIAGPFQGADVRFSEGRCAVWSEGAFGYIDTTGELVVPYRHRYADHFSEGLAVVKTEMGGQYGYIDRSGSMVVPERFTIANPFCNGLAMVMVGDTLEERTYGYIDSSGKLVWELQR